MGGFTEEVILHLSLKRSSGEKCLGKREDRLGRIWTMRGSRVCKRGLADHVKDTIFFPRWIGSHHKVWERYSRKTTPNCDVGS